MAKIQVHVTATKSGIKYKGTIHLNEKNLIITVRNEKSLRNLLLDIKRAMERNKWSYEELTADFHGISLSEDDKLAWETPLEILSETVDEKQMAEVGESNRFSKQSQHVIKLHRGQRVKGDNQIKKIKTKKKSIQNKDAVGYKS